MSLLQRYVAAKKRATSGKKKVYLNFTALQDDSSISIIHYNEGDGVYSVTQATLFISYDTKNWTSWDGSTLSLNQGDKVYVYGDNANYTHVEFCYEKFIMSGKIAADGNIMSYVSKDMPNEIPQEYMFYYLFSDCTSLTTAPDLPATTLANSCYGYMFYGCTSLTTAPDLPATTLANYCYQRMFINCSSLTTAPTLPATNLANSCYEGMFYNCSSLTTAPTLPATTLANHCYYSMFYNCTNLNYIKAMFLTTPTIYTRYWVFHVSSSGTFIKNANATWNVTGTSGIPSGWTVQTEQIESEAG